MYQQRCYLSNYRTRNNRDLHIPKVNLEQRKKGIQYFVITAWNEIPVEIREMLSLSTFKENLKDHLLSNDKSK